MTQVNGKLEPRAEVGVFLGYSAKGAWVAGVWRKDKKCKSGWKFHDIETWACRFDESKLVSDINNLKDLAAGATMSVPVTPREMLPLENCEPCEPVGSGVGDGIGLPSRASSGPEVPVPLEQRSASRDDGSNKGLEGGSVPEVVEVKRRGRKKGVKAQPHWQRTGPKPKLTNKQKKA